MAPATNDHHEIRTFGRLTFNGMQTWATARRLNHGALDAGLQVGQLSSPRQFLCSRQVVDP